MTYLLKAIFSAPFSAEIAKYADRLQSMAKVLREIAKAKTAMDDSVMSSYVAEKVEDVTDDVLPNICPFIENDLHI